MNAAFDEISTSSDIDADSSDSIVSEILSKSSSVRSLDEVEDAINEGNIPSIKESTSDNIEESSRRVTNYSIDTLDIDLFHSKIDSTTFFGDSNVRFDLKEDITTMTAVSIKGRIIGFDEIQKLLSSLNETNIEFSAQICSNVRGDILSKGFLHYILTNCENIVKMTEQTSDVRIIGEEVLSTEHRIEILNNYSFNQDVNLLFQSFFNKVVPKQLFDKIGLLLDLCDKLCQTADSGLKLLSSVAHHMQQRTFGFSRKACHGSALLRIFTGALHDLYLFPSTLDAEAEVEVETNAEILRGYALNVPVFISEQTKDSSSFSCGDAQNVDFLCFKNKKRRTCDLSSAASSSDYLDPLQKESLNCNSNSDAKFEGYTSLDLDDSPEAICEDCVNLNLLNKRKKLLTNPTGHGDFNTNSSEIIENWNERSDIQDERLEIDEEIVSFFGTIDQSEAELRRNKEKALIEFHSKAEDFILHSKQSNMNVAEIDIDLTPARKLNGRTEKELGMESIEVGGQENDVTEVEVEDEDEDEDELFRRDPCKSYKYLFAVCRMYFTITIARKMVKQFTKAYNIN